MRDRYAVSFVRLLSAIALAGTIVATTTAQSLGELAKKEEERRKAVKTPGKVLTNDTLRSVPTPLSPAASTSSPPETTPDKAGSKAGNAGADKDKKPKPEDDRKTQEASWRAKMQGARDALQRSQMFADALQSRINGLSADFTSRDDAAQRDAVARDRQKALAELERVKDEIVKQTKAIADVQEEARKAGVPPGWVR